MTTTLRCTWDLGWPTRLGPLCGAPAVWTNEDPDGFDQRLVGHLPALLCEAHANHPDVRPCDRRRMRRLP